MFQMKLVRAAIAAFVLLGVGVGPARAGIGHGVAGVKGGEHHLTRPQGQYQVNSTTSYASVAPTAPAGSASESVEFDYFCDSEPNFDFLRVLVNGVQAWSQSGSNRRGHVKLAVALGATLSFQYTKDSSVSVGLDTAWVDNVVFSSSVKSSFAIYHFNDWPGTVPTGWTQGGVSGGFAAATPYAQRSAGRPPSQAGVVSSTSTLATTVTFPAATSYTMTFRYYVDSEANYDFLRVYDTVTGGVKTQVFAISGLKQTGTRTVSLTVGGAHSFSFEYSKDGSVDAGRDDARITSVQFRAGATLIGGDDFAGRAVGVTPPTWTGGGSGGGFVVDELTPHKSYVPEQVPAVEPLADGISHGLREYPDATQAWLQNLGVASARPSVLDLYASASTGTFYVALDAQSADNALGNEAGKVTMWFDSGVNVTLRDTPSCGTTGVAPGPEDRQVSFSYASAGATSNITISGLDQKKYVCGSGWVALVSGDLVWPVQVAARESPTGNSGNLMIEVGIRLPTAIFSTDGRLGFGLRRTNPTAGITYERFPYRDDLLAVPDGDNAFSWETIYLQDVVGLPEPSDLTNDLCCFAQSNRRY